MCGEEGSAGVIWPFYSPLPPIEPEECRPLFDNLFKTPASFVDLAAIPDKELRDKLQGHVQAQALLLSLKHVFDSNLQEYLETVLLSTFQALE